jgi:2'-5' RNA ligase
MGQYQSLPQFYFDLNRSQAFPSFDNPRVLVLAGQAGNSPLSYLQSRFQMELDQLNPPSERRLFVPHITLFRFKNDKFNFKALPQLALNLHVLEFALYESQSEIGRVRYEIIESWKLK